MYPSQVLCGLEYVDESQCINVPAVSLDGISWKAVTTQKYQGVVIDHRLTWKFQVAKVCLLSQLSLLSSEGRSFQCIFYE